MTPAEEIVNATLPGGLAVAAEVSERIQEIVKKYRDSPDGMLAAVRVMLGEVAPVYAETLNDAMLAAWLAAAQVTAEPAKPPPQRISPFQPEPRSLIEPAFNRGGPEPVLRLPLIDSAAKWLGNHVPTLRGTYDQLLQQAKSASFTIASLGTETALTKIRDALIDSINEGGTLHDFRRNIAGAVEGSPLSEWGIETLYRTNIGRAYSAGQQAVLNTPLVGTEFPYVLYSATGDSRTRPEHLMMEHLGIQGTAVYRADDPVIRKFWPPWAWNCRCSCIPLSLEDAANDYGIQEAKIWLRTGQPPQYPTFVKPPPFDLPKGWIPVSESGIVAAV